MQSGAEVVPLIRGAIGRLEKLDRSELHVAYEQMRTTSNEWIRRMVVENGRVDILATYVLGYEVKPFHLAMMRWQMLHPRSLSMSYRGSGKTTICTVCRVIYYLCVTRDIRILLVSESKSSAADILREVKGHLEGNERLIEIFGAFYDPRLVSKWDTTAIEVVGRKLIAKEPTIMCAGPDTAITGKHFDVGLPDDLVTEDNARSPNMRQRVYTWYYKTYRPLIMAPDPMFRFRGEQHHSGTRYNPSDLYGHLLENDLKDDTFIVDCFDENENVPWPEVHSAEYFKAVRDEVGLIIFNSQYRNDTEAMKGEIFDYDDCLELNDAEFPKLEELRLYMGVDLACDEKERKENAQFAICVIGIKGSWARNDVWIYVVDYFLQHLKPTAQPDKVLEFYDKYTPLRVGIETVQYQNYLAVDVKEKRPSMVVKRINTKLDKTSRAWKRARHFENNRVFFRKNIHKKPIDALVRLPGCKWDFFDAFDDALEASQKKPRTSRERKTFGLL
jgi:hypothetical protein